MAAASPPVEAIGGKRAYVLYLFNHQRLRKMTVDRQTGTLPDVDAMDHGLPIFSGEVTALAMGLLVVSVAWRHRKGAMGKRQEIHKSEMKELIETAIAQVDVAGSTLSTMSYY
ncbi:hypothetical protein ZWY2020_006893 [Hordeum vulgare]|nr:hypothetical protein ZWY2020_006893 [Hordeum vulgare]